MAGAAMDWLTKFTAAWERELPLAPPVGYLMRERCGKRWFRIHSLSGSKRYPETEAEYAELLRRHNAICDALFGHGEPLVLVVPAYGDVAGPYPTREPEPGRDVAPPSPIPSDLVPFRCIDPRDLDPQADPELDSFIYLSAAPLVWRSGATDAMIRAAADDRERFLLVSMAADRVYAPYDGGADIFLPASERPAAWRARYAEWLSVDPSGM